MSWAKFKANLKRLIPGRTTDGDLAWVAALLVTLIASLVVFLAWFLANLPNAG